MDPLCSTAEGPALGAPHVRLSRDRLSLGDGRALPVDQQRSRPVQSAHEEPAPEFPESLRRPG